jgi:hypothetical protein
MWETVPVRLRLRVQKALLKRRAFFVFMKSDSIFFAPTSGTKSAEEKNRFLNEYKN